MARTPLAWRNLSHDPVRFALFLAGVVFAVVLMFVQLGFRGALLDSQTALHARVDADLILVNPLRASLPMRETLPLRRVVQARGVAGVASAEPLYIDNGGASLRDATVDATLRGPNRTVRVVGVDPRLGLLDLPELDPASATARALGTPGAALYDRLARADAERPGASVYGPLEVGGSSELAGRRVAFVGSVALGPDFTSDGTLIVSDRTFADLVRGPQTAGPPLAEVDYGLVKLEPGADPAAVRAALQRLFAAASPEPDAEVLTKAEFVAREQAFWLSNTPIGFAFNFGMAMGFAVGLVICYQILSGDVADHLAEYATLKAIGYPNRSLAGVVLREALILAAAGYAAGLVVSLALYQLLEALTAMPLVLRPDRALLVLAATVAMCVASGLLSLGKLVRADPADVFA